jgi:beta-mannosidase
MRRDFHVPTDFASFLYVSQVLQATIIQYAAEAHRRRWPYNAGSLYWQLDDCWPVASWSGIDYFGRWKALHYAARRFFAPVLVSPVVDGAIVRVFVVSDRGEAFRGRLGVRLVDLAGANGRPLVPPLQTEVVVKARSSEAHLAVSRADLLRDADARRVVLVAELHDERGGLVARNLLLFVKTREVALPAPGLETATEARPGAVAVHVTARQFARAVWLSTPGEDGAFSENFFDLLPGETVTSTWTPAAGSGPIDASRLAAVLRVVTIRETY